MALAGLGFLALVHICPGWWQREVKRLQASAERVEWYEPYAEEEEMEATAEPEAPYEEIEQEGGANDDHEEEEEEEDIAPPPSRETCGLNGEFVDIHAVVGLPRYARQAIVSPDLQVINRERISPDKVPHLGRNRLRRIETVPSHSMYRSRTGHSGWRHGPQRTAPQPNLQLCPSAVRPR